MVGGYAAPGRAARGPLMPPGEEPRVSAELQRDTPGVRAGFARSRNLHVMYSLFAPQGSGKAESLTPLKRRTTPHRSQHLECCRPPGLR